MAKECVEDILNDSLPCIQTYHLKNKIGDK